MKPLAYLLPCVMLAGLAPNMQACTAFALRDHHRLYVGKNLDWSLASGYVFLNERGEQRVLLRNPQFTWRARYRSLSFNQHGKDFPLGGMNETGLVVEELNMTPVSLSMDSVKTSINELQLVQYLLDNCGSIDQVKEMLEGFQLIPLFQSLHYFIADRFGNVMVAEFDGSEFQYFCSDEKGPAVLSNNHYQESLRYLRNFQGFGGEQEVIHRQGSNERFVSVAAMLANYANQPPVDFAFKVLDTIAQDDTRWSLVYDIGKQTIYCLVQGCGQEKRFDLGELFSRKSVSGLGGNLETCDIRNNQDLYMVSADENAEALRKVFENKARQEGVPCDYPLLYEMAVTGDPHLQPQIPKQIIEELNQEIQALPVRTPLQFPDSFFDGLADWGSYRVVGLGEATHGTREFCQLKHRVFEYLVEKHHYRVLAYEYSFRKSLRINEYILEGTGDIDSILSGESWIQDNGEVKDLIHWMRSYNRDRASRDKVQFIGIDAQLDAINLPELLSLMEDEYPAFCHTQAELMEKIRQMGHIDYSTMPKEEYIQKKAIYSDLVNAARDYEGPDRDVLVNLARSLVNSHDFLYAIFVQKVNPRDRQLAEQVLNIHRFMAKNHKVAVWAHNAHIGDNPDYYGPGDGSMGKYLKDTLKDRYLAIGTSFSNGEFTAVMIDSSGHDTPPFTCRIDSNPPGVSSNFLLHSARYSSFVLNLQTLSGTGLLKPYFDIKRPLMGVGDCYLGSPEQHFSQDRILKLSEAFDLLFYFENTHPISL